MPSARLRLAGGAAFLVLVAFGLWLAQLDPVVIGVAMLIALVLVALLHRAASRAEARPAESDERPAAQIEPGGAQPVAVATGANEPVTEPAPLPEPTVSERSARAILASAHPPPPREPARPERTPGRRVQRAPTRPPEPEMVEITAASPRAWNLWDLQRAVRDADEEARHAEWSALLIHLREFANADGDLPLEFDGLVRESFGPILATELEPAAAP